MLCCVGAPRPPGFGATQNIRRSRFPAIHCSHATETANVSRRKCVYLANRVKVVLALPGAQAVSFDSGTIREVRYEETLPFQIYRRFFGDRENFMQMLFSELNFKKEGRDD
jgi:hypothetical protein